MTDNKKRSREKNPDIARIVRNAARNRGKKSLFSEHAIERMFEQDIDQFDVFEVLARGSRKAGKDQYDVERAKWRYAFDHELDERVIRVVVSEIAHRGATIVIITAIDVKFGKR